MEEKRFRMAFRRKIKTVNENSFNGIIDLLSNGELCELHYFLQDLYKKKSFEFLQPIRLQEILKEDDNLLKLLAK